MADHSEGHNQESSEGKPVEYKAHKFMPQSNSVKIDAIDLDQPTPELVEAYTPSVKVMENAQFVVDMSTPSSESDDGGDEFDSNKELDLDLHIGDTSALHHEPVNVGVGGEISDMEMAEIQNMAAIRSLLFGKQTAQLNKRINDLEGHFEEVARGHSERINSLEKEHIDADVIEQLQGRVETLEADLLSSTKSLKESIENSDRENQMRLFEQVRNVSDATLKDFRSLRQEVRGEFERIKQNEKNNSQVGEVLVSLGRQLQGKDLVDRTISDEEL